MTTPVGPPNYRQLKKLRFGKEVTRGLKVAPTNPWYGVLALTAARALADSEEYDGSFSSDINPVRGALEVTGTYQQQMSYDDPQIFDYGIRGGGVAPTDDGNTVHGYTHPFRPTLTADDLDTGSAEFGTQGMIFESQGLFFPELTISSDIDDAQAVWKLSAQARGITDDLKAGLNDVAATGGSTTTFIKSAWAQTISAWVGAWLHFKSGTAGNIGLWRQVTANDATTLTFAALPSSVASGDVIDVYPVYTSGLSDRARDMIKGPGTLLYLDAATIGTTLVSGRFRSFSVTQTLNSGYKRMFENVDTMSNRMDRGMIRVSGQVVLEFDRKREWDNYKAMTPEKMRITQPNGPTIDSGAGTKKSATIDIFKAVWDTPTEDVRGNNVVATWPFRGYKDLTEANHWEVRIKNTQATRLA